MYRSLMSSPLAKISRNCHIRHRIYSLPLASSATSDKHNIKGPVGQLVLRNVSTNRVSTIRTVCCPSARFFTTSNDGSGNGKDSSDDPDTAPRFQTINSTLTEEEIAQIMEEEELLLQRAIESKTVENWKPGMRKRPLKVSFNEQDFDPDRNEWTLRDKRTGALAIKVGMMPVFDPMWGVRFPCTVLLLDGNVVVGQKTKDRHGYDALQVAAGQRKRKNVGKSVLGQYHAILADDTEHPPYLMREFRVNPDCLLPVGARIHASHFVPGQNLDVSGTSSGKGFQGGMKRHGFGGLPASHGVSRAHRALGSTGQCQDPGKVWKGKKMAGRMGGVRVTTQNVRLIKVDRGRNLLYVQGSVPGKKGNFIEIRDAVKKPLWNTPLVLDNIERPPIPSSEYDEVDGSGNGGFEVFMPLPEKDPLSPLEDAA